MRKNAAIDVLSALAQETRLDVFRMLVRAEPEGRMAGEIAKVLDVPHNTMSTHLAILERSGLVTSEKRSRAIIYRAKLAGLQKLMRYLIMDCCNGKPELCAGLIEDLKPCCAPARKLK